MRQRVFRVSISWFCVAIVTFLFWTGLGSNAHAFTEEQRLLSEVWRIVDRAYLDDTFNHQNWWNVRQRALRQPLRDRQQAYSSIRTMLASLGDPFTRFMDPDQYRSLQTTTSGELSGVGLQISQDEETGELLVIAPIEGSPAEEAGIQPRDRILKINGIATNTMTLDEAADRMRGTVGSLVTLTVVHGVAEPVDMDLMRDHITLDPVNTAFSKDEDSDTHIGYIRLKQFNANATESLAHAIADLDEQGANAYILDLRNNPGGLLQAGIEVAQLWLDEGVIVYTVNRQGIFEVFEANGSALTNAPLVVLVNQGTASASEILAGALQDNQRAQLVGDRTFGKGLIQSLFNLSDGSGLAVTIAKYETPDHHDINRQGIQPDVVVPSEPLTRAQIATPDDLQYQTAVDLLTHHAVLASTPSV